MKLLKGYNPNETPTGKYNKHHPNSESVTPIISHNVTHFDGTAGSPDKLIDRKAPIRKSDWEIGAINNNSRPRISIPDDEEERPISKHAKL